MIGLAVLLIIRKPHFRRMLAALSDLVHHWRHYGNADLSEHAQCSVKQYGPEQNHILNHLKALRNACAVQYIVCLGV